LLGEQVWKENFDPEFDENSVTTSKQLKTVYAKIANRQNIAFMAASDYAYASDQDQEHLSEEGHRRLAQALLTKIKSI
jgi:hypothetical protein